MDWQQTAVWICVAAAAAAAVWRTLRHMRTKHRDGCCGCGSSDCPNSGQRDPKKAPKIKK